MTWSFWIRFWSPGTCGALSWTLPASTLPILISGASDYDFVTDELSSLPWEQIDSEEDQGIGWGLHLGQEFWDIRPLLCDDGSP